MGNMDMNKKSALGEKIRHLRERLDWSQEQLAAKLGIPRPSVSQVESGRRDVSTSELMKLSDIFGLSVDELLNPKCVEREMPRPGYIKELPKFNEDLFRNILLYILIRCGARPNVGKTVLYKLLYFCDFNYYELYEEHLTGAAYRRISYGPAPCNFDDTMKKMIKGKEVQELTVDYYGKAQIKYIPLVEPDMNKLTVRQKEVVDKVIERLSSYDAEKISAYSHEDMPWKAAKDKEIIDYEFVFYRTPSYSERSYTEE